MVERKMMINPRDEYLISKGMEKGKEEGMKEGKVEGKLEIAKKLLERMTPQDVAEITGLSEKQLSSLIL